MNEADRRATVRRLAWTDPELGDIPLPTTIMRVRASFGSGLSRRAGDPDRMIWACGDRGPNLKVKTLSERYGVHHPGHAAAEAGAKVMPRLDLGPTIAQLRLLEDTVELIDTYRIVDQLGLPLSGLPVPGSEHARCEPALDLEGNLLPPDPAGLDTEGIACLRDGGAWLSDEFGPSLVRVDAAGVVQARYVPYGVELAGAAYPVHAVLPDIAAKRQINRGFEAIALSPDERWLFVAFQSPLAHPDEAAHQHARHVRIWRLCTTTLKVEAQYLYPLDQPLTFRHDSASGPLDWSNLKLSELVGLEDDRLLVLERGSKSAKIYSVDLMDACALGSEHLDVHSRPTVEELSAAHDFELPCLPKHLLFSTDDAPEIAADLEGMVLLSPSELLLVNDNDFGVEEAETTFWLINLGESLLEETERAFDR